MIAAAAVVVVVVAAAAVVVAVAAVAHVFVFAELLKVLVEEALDGAMQVVIQNASVALLFELYLLLVSF